MLLVNIPVISFLGAQIFFKKEYTIVFTWNFFIRILTFLDLKSYTNDFEEKKKLTFKRFSKIRIYIPTRSLKFLICSKNLYIYVDYNLHGNETKTILTIRNIIC